MLDSCYCSRAVLTLVATAIGIAITGCPKPQPADPKFSIILLDPREGEAYAINENGEVAGNLTYSKSAAFIWQSGHSPKLTELGTLGGSRSFAYDINNYGEVCGVAALADERNQAFRWTAANGLEGLGSTGFDSSAYGINDDSVIVGKSDEFGGAFVWRDVEGMIAVPGADVGSWAEKINGFSNIVGNQKGDPVSVTQDEGRVWRGEAAPYNITNTLGGGDVRAFAMNDTLTVVGWAEDEEFKRVAMKWTKGGGMSALGDLGHYIGFDNLPGPWVAEAYSVNFHGDIVGSAVSDPGIAAVLWRDGKTYELNDLIPAAAKWTNLERAYDINNQGCIVGRGRTDSDLPFETHAFLLVPAVLYAVEIAPSTVPGGMPITVQAFLDGDAPFALDIEANLLILSRMAKRTSAVGTVREGARSTEFQIETQPVDSEQTGELRVRFGGTTLRSSITVTPE